MSEFLFCSVIVVMLSQSCRCPAASDAVLASLYLAVSQHRAWAEGSKLPAELHLQVVHAL